MSIPTDKYENMYARVSEALSETLNAIIQRGLNDMTTANSLVIYGRNGLDRVLLDYSRKKDLASDLDWTTFEVKRFVPNIGLVQIVLMLLGILRVRTNP
jgi:succinate dehydrogenase hydrophobic anchor subunit